MQGSFAVAAPYAAEAWPKNLKATGMGSAYGFGGLGKIVGPMILATIAGSANLIQPKFVEAAIIPTFIVFGILPIIGGIAMRCGIETKGKSIEEIDRMINAGKVKGKVKTEVGA